MNNKGFTLVEMIVVISITAVLGVIFTNTLVQTLRSQSKTKVISQVKQNGQIVLGRLSTEIRQAEKIICINNKNGGGGDQGDTLVIFKNGNYQRFRFHRPEPAENPTVNGYIEWDEFTTSEYGEEKDAQGSCQDSALLSLPGRIKYLTDRDTKNGISLDLMDGTSNAFSRTSKAGYGDLVTIQFKAQAGVGSGILYEDLVKEGGIPFSTTVQVKGLKK